MKYLLSILLLTLSISSQAEEISLVCKDASKMMIIKGKIQTFSLENFSAKLDVEMRNPWIDVLDNGWIEGTFSGNKLKFEDIVRWGYNDSSGEWQWTQDRRVSITLDRVTGSLRVDSKVVRSKDGLLLDWKDIYEATCIKSNKLF